MTRIVAHRGFSAAAPENTMAAFFAALEAGAEGFELDVQLTRDGEVVIFHDEKVDRTSDGVGWLKDHSLGELRRLDAGSWFGPSFRGERVPLLRELLATVQGRRIFINVELKNSRFPYPGLEEKVLQIVEEHDLTEQVAISSFNHYSLRTIRSLHPSIETGILYMSGLVDPWLYARHLQAQALHPYYPNIVPELVEGARRERMPVRPWTVDSEDDMRCLLQAGVESIITNRPDVLLALRSQR